MLHGESVPPGRVRARRDEANHRCSFMHCRAMGLGHPACDCLPIRLIHKNDLIAQGLEHAIVFTRVMFLALCIGVRQTGIELVAIV